MERLRTLPWSQGIRSCSPGVHQAGGRIGSRAFEERTTFKAALEDGIFGTSGRIGFTKQNELFVGRVAMIGFTASLIREAITGKGILAQPNLETGIPLYDAEPLLLFFILFMLLGAIGSLGDSGKFVDDPTPTTGLDRAVIPPERGFTPLWVSKKKGPCVWFHQRKRAVRGKGDSAGNNILHSWRN